jgi:hypothetical protein
MSSARFPSLSVFIVAATLLGATPSAIAIPKIAYTVGGDVHCDFSDIPAAVAAAAANPPHNIWVAVNATYSAEKIAITNQDVSITGGFPNCSSLVSPSGETTISGAGNGGQDSVIYITGTSNVTLSNLAITGGNLPIGNNGKDGGGISFAGDGTLSIAQSSVFNNNANSGAGINMNGTTSATLTIGANMFITGNGAHDSGGGIRAQGHTRLFILEDGVFIAQNHADTGNGGGIQVIGPARADIGSPGAGNTGVITDNHAVNGGGVSVDAGQDLTDATLRLFSTDATRMARISNNTASNVGGGIYLKPYTTSFSHYAGASVCAHDYRIDGNVAMEGAAIYADTDSSFATATLGGYIILEPPTGRYLYCDPETPESLGAVACTLGASCNMIDGNEAADINNNNQPTDGATIFEQDGSQLFADRLMLRGNSGGYALRNTGGSNIPLNVILSNCLFADNQLTHELIFGDSGAGLSIDSCTLANDGIGSVDVIHNEYAVTIASSIIDEPGTSTLHYLGDPGNLHVSYVMSNDTSTLPNVPGVVQDNPFFVDVAHGDYRLQAKKVGNTIFASPAIDFAPAEGGTDLGGRQRDKDIGAIVDEFGVRDLGAFEMQPISDRIFADGFGDAISLVY